MTIGELIQDLLLTTDLSNQEIVDKVKEQFPDAKTTTKSVASVASVARRFGVAVPKRKVENPYDRIRELEAQVAELQAKIDELTNEDEEEVA